MTRIRSKYKLPGTRTSRGCVAVIGLFLLAGCVVGPDFAPPPAPDADGYLHGEAPTQTGAAPGEDGVAQVFVRAGAVQADWYRLFRSAELNQLVLAALSNSPTLRAGRARLRAAREDLDAAQAGLLPNITASANVSRNKVNGTAFGIDNPLFSNIFTLYEGQLSLGYNLDIFGEVRRGIENREARLAFARYQLLDTYLTLINNVVATALADAGIGDSIDATQEIIATQQDNLDLLQRQERLGAVARSEVLRARAQLADSISRLPPLQKQQVIARHRLAQLTGVAPADFSAPQLRLANFRLPEQLPVSLPADLVRQRPDILAAQSLLHAANAQVGVAAAQRLPSLTISADYTRHALDLSGLTDPAAVVYNFGAGLAAPLFDGGRLRANERAAQARRDAAAARYDATVLAAFSEVASSLRALQSDADNLRARAQALTAARDNLDLVIAQIDRGAADYLNLYTAQNLYQRALIRHTQARLERYRDTAQLFRALGGGWWNATAENRPDPQATTSGTLARRPAQQ